MENSNIFRKLQELNGKDILLLWEGNEVNGVLYDVKAINTKFPEHTRRYELTVESGRVLLTFDHLDIKSVSTDEQNIIVLLP